MTEITVKLPDPHCDLDQVEIDNLRKFYFEKLEELDKKDGFKEKNCITAYNLTYLNYHRTYTNLHSEESKTDVALFLFDIVNEFLKRELLQILIKSLTDFPESTHFHISFHKKES
jgi:hypothetical protein